MRERNFGGLPQARLVFEARVNRAKEALRHDLETIECTKVVQNEQREGHPAKSVQVAALREYDRALLVAFDEYLQTTTDYIPDDPEERARWAEMDLEQRREALRVMVEGRDLSPAERNRIEAT